MKSEASQLTPWFPGSVKPVRRGVYQQMCGLGKDLGYQLWDGEHWHSWCDTAEQAADKDFVIPADLQNDPWRGLKMRSK